MIRRKVGSVLAVAALAVLTASIALWPTHVGAQNSRTTNPAITGGADSTGSVHTFNTDANGNQIVVPTASAQDANGYPIVARPDTWTGYNVPSTATQATFTKAAGATGIKHVLTSLSFSVSAGATAQTPLLVYVRDGATGAGTILWAGVVGGPANTEGQISMSGLNIKGSAATAMTVEFAGAGVTASQEVVSCTGYDSL